MDLKLTRRKIRLDYDGLKCEVFIPTTKQIAAFDKKLKENKGEEAELIASLLLELGVSQEILDILDMISLQELLEVISGKKSLKRI